MSKTGLDVKLKTDVAYVAGTVNGESVVFTQNRTNPVLWYATVDVAPDNLYHIYLEVYDLAGNRSVYEQTIEYSMPIFIFDRTQSDVDRVKELAVLGHCHMTEEQKKEWSRGLKGSYNRTDAARNEKNCKMLAEFLKLDINTYQDSVPLHPDADYWHHLLNNVSAIRESGYHYRTTPEVPDMPINTYQKANDIERILYDVYTVFSAIVYYYAGTEIYAGEEIGLLE